MSDEPKTVQVTLSTEAGTQAFVGTTVERGLNELRLAVLGILVTIGLTFGFGMNGSWGAKLA